jgi:uncharacterized protein YggT (Ycf19 family)
MALIDFILNLAALFLWLNWLSIHFDPLARTPAASLVGTLKKADPSGPRRGKFLAGLAALLLIRAWIYCQIITAVSWTPKINLVFTSLPFRGDYFTHMLLFSLLGFLLVLADFYLWLLLLSVANSRVPDDDPLQRVVRLLLKWIERWPNPVKLLLPALSGGVFWLALHPVLARLAIVPGIKSTAQLFEQAALIGMGAYLDWKYLIAAILLLHLLGSYVYFGEHPAWNFIHLTARNLLSPLRWLPLRFGKVDLLPLAGIALVILAPEFLSRPPQWPPQLVYFNQWLCKLLPF